MAEWRDQKWVRNNGDWGPAAWLLGCLLAALLFLGFIAIVVIVEGNGDCPAGYVRLDYHGEDYECVEE